MWLFLLDRAVSMLQRAFRASLNPIFHHLNPPVIGGYGPGIRRRFAQASTRPKWTLKGSNLDLVALGIALGICIPFLVRRKEDKSVKDVSQKLLTGLLALGWTPEQVDEAVIPLLQISQYVPFADLESALEVLPDTLPTTLRSVLRMDSLYLSSAGPPSLFFNNVEVTLPTSGSKLHGCGIFGGQKGPAMAKLLQDQLMTRIVAAIDGLYAPSARKRAHAVPTPTPEMIKKSLTDAFIQHDNRVLYRAVQMAERIKKNKVSRRDAKALVDPLSSAMALITLYDDQHRTLYVARIGGGGRAVLGRRVADPTRDKYEAHTISREEAGNDDIQRTTRIFGDSARKWTTAVLQNIHEKYLGPPPIDDQRPRPTAEPLVSHFSAIQRGDFVVVGSEGLWGSLDSEQVIGLVGKWLEERGVRELTRSSDGTVREVFVSPAGTKDPKDLQESTFSPDELPVVYPKGYEDTTRRYTSWKTQKRFLSLPKDENVASHIVRNALGGADRDLAEALYQIRGERGKELRWVIRAWVRASLIS
ncbi:hypothetical protein NLJ89_g1739 [Agrocybe chaxingu]|uniref:PPM-type phosphatase domain-containing protein n=1 Tax=Agrocybe chaxingu TaxID=84603 RepID=A0A9W8TEQ4_9AGAR|nr:hypothetical protein NLJ89_g1739 [Agrocybe chaxingu]